MSRKRWLGFFNRWCTPALVLLAGVAGLPALPVEITSFTLPDASTSNLTPPLRHTVEAGENYRIRYYLKVSSNLPGVTLRLRAEGSGLAAPVEESTTDFLPQGEGEIYTLAPFLFIPADAAEEAEVIVTFSIESGADSVVREDRLIVARRAEPREAGVNFAPGALAASPDGQWWAIGDETNSAVWLIEAATGEVRGGIHLPGGIVPTGNDRLSRQFVLQFSPSSQRLQVAQDRTLTTLTIPDLEIQGRLTWSERLQGWGAISDTRALLPRRSGASEVFLVDVDLESGESSPGWNLTAALSDPTSWSQVSTMRPLGSPDRWLLIRHFESRSWGYHAAILEGWPDQPIARNLPGLQGTVPPDWVHDPATDTVMVVGSTLHFHSLDTGTLEDSIAAGGTGLDAAIDPAGAGPIHFRMTTPGGTRLRRISRQMRIPYHSEGLVQAQPHAASLTAVGTYGRVAIAKSTAPGVISSLDLPLPASFPTLRPMPGYLAWAGVVVASAEGDQVLRPGSHADVAVWLRNAGGEPLNGVRVILEATQPGVTVETTEATIDLAPGTSQSGLAPARVSLDPDFSGEVALRLRWTIGGRHGSLRGMIPVTDLAPLQVVLLSSTYLAASLNGEWLLLHETEDANWTAVNRLTGRPEWRTTQLPEGMGHDNGTRVRAISPDGSRAWASFQVGPAQSELWRYTAEGWTHLPNVNLFSGHVLAADDGTALWIQEVTGNQARLRCFDADSGAELADLPLPAETRWIEDLGNGTWLLGAYPNPNLILDLTSRTLQPADVGLEGRIAWDRQSEIAYRLHSEKPYYSVERFRRDGTHLGTLVPAATNILSSSVLPMALSPDGNYLGLIRTGEGNRLLWEVIDTGDGRIVSTTPLLAPDGQTNSTILGFWQNGADRGTLLLRGSNPQGVTSGNGSIWLARLAGGDRLLPRPEAFLDPALDWRHPADESAAGPTAGTTRRVLPGITWNGATLARLSFTLTIEEGPATLLGPETLPPVWASPGNRAAPWTGWTVQVDDGAADGTPLRLALTVTSDSGESIVRRWTGRIASRAEYGPLVAVTRWIGDPARPRFYGRASNQLYGFDSSTGEWLPTLTLPITAGSIQISPAGDRLAVWIHTENRLVLVRLDTWQVEDVVYPMVGNLGTNIVLTPGGGVWMSQAPSGNRRYWKAPGLPYWALAEGGQHSVADRNVGVDHEGNAWWAMNSSTQLYAPVGEPPRSVHVRNLGQAASVFDSDLPGWSWLREGHVGRMPTGSSIAEKVGTLAPELLGSSRLGPGAVSWNIINQSGQWTLKRQDLRTAWPYGQFGFSHGGASSSAQPSVSNRAGHVLLPFPTGEAFLVGGTLPAGSPATENLPAFSVGPARGAVAGEPFTVLDPGLDPAVSWTVLEGPGPVVAAPVDGGFSLRIDSPGTHILEARRTTGPADRLEVLVGADELPTLRMRPVRTEAYADPIPWAPFRVILERSGPLDWPVWFRSMTSTWQFGDDFSQMPPGVRSREFTRHPGSSTTGGTLQIEVMPPYQTPLEFLTLSVLPPNPTISQAFANWATTSGLPTDPSARFGPGDSLTAFEAFARGFEIHRPAPTGDDFAMVIGPNGLPRLRWEFIRRRDISTFLRFTPEQSRDGINWTDRPPIQSWVFPIDDFTEHWRVDFPVPTGTDPVLIRLRIEPL